MQITVITPTYNNARHLRQNIESVAAQKQVELEHIVIDDGSTDESRDILNDCKNQYPHLKVIFLDENMGQAHARNAGLDAACGEYVAFLDSDDYYLHDVALFAWLQSAQSNNADLVRASYVRVIYETGDKKPAQSILSQAPQNDINIDTAPELVNNTSCWLLLYRRAFLQQHRIRFSSRLRQREDRPFFLLAMLHARTVNLIPDELIAYCVHDASTMRQVTWEQLALFCTHLDVVADYLEQYASKPERKPFRRANLLYYVRHILEYWAPLLAQSDARYRPEFQQFFSAARQLQQDTGLLREDLAVERIDPVKLDNYYYDFAWLLIEAGLGEAFQTFWRDEAVSIAQAVALAEVTANLPSARQAEAGEVITKYLRNKPPLCAPLTEGDGRRHSDALPPILLHAGMTKTGSSSLQHFLELNRFELYRRYGIYYPFTGLEFGSGAREHRTSGHAGLIGSILSGNEAGVTKLTEEIHSLPHPPRKIVLSSENIVSERFWRHGDAPRLIAHAFDGSDVEILVYFRRQEDWLESAYVESVTSPGLRFKGTPADFAAEQRRAGLLDYTAVDSAWRAYFTADKLHYRSYEKARAAGDVIDDFLDVIGIADSAPGCRRPVGDHRNESASKSAAYLISKLNHFGVPRPRVVELNAEMIAAARTMSGEPQGTSPPDFYGGRARAEITSLCDLSNRAFYNRYIGEMPPDRRTGNEPDWLETAMIPVPLLERFFDLLLTEQKSRKRGKSKGPGQTTADARQPATGRHAPDPQLTAFASRWITRIRCLANKKLRAAVRQAQIIDGSGWFDHEFYLQHTPEAAGYPGGPVMHFVERGAQERRNPSAAFDIGKYLAINTDVAVAGINPLYHYLKYGKDEARALE